MKTAGMVAGGPEDWSDYSYGVYVDLNKLKTQLKQIFKKKPIPGQPTNKKENLTIILSMKKRW